jgi:hypothetical protein
MQMRISGILRAVAGSVSATAIILAAGAAEANNVSIQYVGGSLAQSTIEHGPWTLHETGSFNAHDASGIVPPKTQTAPPYTGTGTPYANLCAGTQFYTNHGRSMMQPYYFPFVRRRGDVLEGFFDYRPRNENEATVAAISRDLGASWEFVGEALALNPYCPWDATDPDNQNVNVGGVKTAYGSSNANAADNGLGHAFVLKVNGVERIYSLNRANNHIDSDQLVTHQLTPRSRNPLSGLPAFGYVSPLASGGYPALDASAGATSGLVTPDAILGSVRQGSTTTVVYVSKTLNGDVNFPAAQICPKTPAFALTNLVNGKPRKTNDDVTAVRIATTTDGVTFTDVGAASGLNDPTTVALNGIRYLGSGSLVALRDGRYGMFFGAGGCLDNDSDGFHFVGYAETANPVRSPADFKSWTIVNGFDNPIISTDTVVDTGQSPARRYPLNAPLVSVTGADLLTAAQVSPFTAPAAAYNTNFFSGRVYDPQAVQVGDDMVAVVFAGYNTPQPSNNLGDYRSIGRVLLRFPHNYLGRAEDQDRDDN